MSAARADRDLRVLVVMYGWADSGGGTMLPRQVAHGLVAAGAATDVFFAAASPRPERGPYALTEWREGGVRLHELSNRPSLFLDLEAPEREIEDPRTSFAFGRVLDSVRPDVVHFYNLHNLGLGLPRQCRERGIPTVLSSNNYWPICPRLYLIQSSGSLCDEVDTGRCASCTGAPGGALEARRRAALECLNEHVDRHLAVSNRVRELFVQNGVRSDRIEVLQQQPASLDLVWREVGLQRSVEGGPTRPLRIGFIGSLLPHKGPQVLVDALRRLPKGSVECTLHGDGDPEFGRMLQGRDPQGILRFGGRYGLEELPTRLASCDVVVVPSIWDDCAPYVVAEALAARAPVVGSAIGGIPDFVEDGRNGFLFRPGDAGDLAERISRFLTDPGLLRRMQSEIRPPRGFGAYLQDLLDVYGQLAASTERASSRTRAGVAQIS